MRALYDAQVIQPPETGGEKVSGNDTSVTVIHLEWQSPGLHTNL